jgi:hypothetical protein
MPAGWRGAVFNQLITPETSMFHITDLMIAGLAQNPGNI